MNTLEFLLEGGDEKSPWWGHSPRMSGGSGVKALSQILSDETLSYSLKHISKEEHFTFHGGALTPYIYISYFQDDVMKWKYVPRYWPFVRGIHRSLGNSPHDGQWCGALMFSLICAWPNGWVNNQDADDLRCHCTHYDVTVMWCRIVIQWSGQPWDLSAFNASLLSNFELMKRVKLGGSVHYGRNGLKFGTLLYPDYHSLKLTIFCTQQQFKFAVSDHPWISFWDGEEINEIYVLYKNECLHAMPITKIIHSACYTVVMGVSAKDLTHNTFDNNHTAYMHICLQGIGCVCVKNYPPEIMQPSSSTHATIVSAENQNDATIVKANFFFCHHYIVWESNNAGDARWQSWNESLKSRWIPGGFALIRVVQSENILLRFLRRGHDDDGCSCNYCAVPPSDLCLWNTAVSRWAT